MSLRGNRPLRARISGGYAQGLSLRAKALTEARATYAATTLEPPGLLAVPYLGPGAAYAPALVGSLGAPFLGPGAAYAPVVSSASNLGPVPYLGPGAAYAPVLVGSFGAPFLGAGAAYAPALQGLLGAPFLGAGAAYAPALYAVILGKPLVPRIENRTQVPSPTQVAIPARLISTSVISPTPVAVVRRAA